MVSNSITSDYHIDRRYYYKYPAGYTDPMINGWQIDVGSRDPVETTSVIYLKTTYAMGDFPSGIGFCISLEKGSGRYSNLRVYVTNKPDLSGDPITSLGLYKEIEIYHNIIAFDNIGYVFRLRLQPWHITDEEIILWFQRYINEHPQQKKNGLINKTFKFDLQLFAYRVVENPHTINPLLANASSKADIIEDISSPYAFCATWKKKSENGYDYLYASTEDGSLVNFNGNKLKSVRIPIIPLPESGNPEDIPDEYSPNKVILQTQGEASYNVIRMNASEETRTEEVSGVDEEGNPTTTTVHYGLIYISNIQDAPVEEKLLISLDNIFGNLYYYYNLEFFKYDKENQFSLTNPLQPGDSLVNDNTFGSFSDQDLYTLFLKNITSRVKLEEGVPLYMGKGKITTASVPAGPEYDKDTKLVNLANYSQNTHKETETSDDGSQSTKVITDYYVNFLDYRVWEINLEYLASVKPTSLKEAFYDCSFEEIDLSNLDTSECTSIDLMFGHSTKSYSGKIKRIIGIENWNTSKITSIVQPFGNCNSLELDLSRWDVSNVTTIKNMFYGYSEGPKHVVSKLNISGWDTSKVQSFENFFSSYGNLELISTPIDLSSCTNITSFIANNCILSSVVHFKNVPISLSFESSGMTEGTDYIIDNYLNDIVRTVSQQGDRNGRGFK